MAVAEEAGEDETRVRLECESGADPREEVFRAAVARGWVLRELTREALSLEDVFVRLTRHEEPAAANAPAASEPETGTGQMPS
jgi:ABC-2 type transport system ATP-binding protein